MYFLANLFVGSFTQILKLWRLWAFGLLPVFLCAVSLQLIAEHYSAPRLLVLANDIPLLQIFDPVKADLILSAFKLLIMVLGSAWFIIAWHRREIAPHHFPTNREALRHPPLFSYWAMWIGLTVLLVPIVGLLITLFYLAAPGLDISQVLRNSAQGAQWGWQISGFWDTHANTMLVRYLILLMAISLPQLASGVEMRFFRGVLYGLRRFLPIFVAWIAVYVALYVLDQQVVKLKYSEYTPYGSLRYGIFRAATAGLNFFQLLFAIALLTHVSKTWRTRPANTPETVFE